MDGQNTSHGESYAYSDASYPEFYDLWVRSLFGTGPSEDQPIFFSTIQDIIHQRQNVNIVDIGTGTGRVVRTLRRDLDSLVGNEVDGKELVVSLIGVDHSSAMLARAKQLWASDDAKAAVHWICASASNFMDTLIAHPPGLVDGPASIDLIIFSVGGIGHLTSTDEIDAFLGQLSKALRHDSGPGKQDHGVAIISVLNEMIPELNPEILLPPKMQGPTELLLKISISSQDIPGGIYTKTPTMIEWQSNGQVRIDRFTVSFAVMEEEKWSKALEWSVKVWNENDWNDALQRAGLEVVKTEQGKIQRWYFLKNKA